MNKDQYGKPPEDGDQRKSPYEIVPGQLSNEVLLEMEKRRADADKFFPKEVVLDKLGRIVHPRQFIMAGRGKAIDRFVVGKKFWLQTEQVDSETTSERIFVDVIKSRKPSPRGKRYVLLQTSTDASTTDFIGKIIKVFGSALAENPIGVIHPGGSNEDGGRVHSGQASCFGTALLVTPATNTSLNQSPEIQRLNQVATYEHDAALGMATVAVLDTGLLAIEAGNANRQATSSDIGWNFATNTSPEGSPFSDDDHPGLHGTKICTIIKHAAPEVGILPVKVANRQGAVSLYDALCGLEFARTHGASVVNASWSFTANGSTSNEELDYPLLLQAIRDLEESGVVVVAAAGNRNQYDQLADGHIGLNNAPYIYPACYSSIQDNVITVTTVVDAVDAAAARRFNAFENFSNRFVDTGVLANAETPEPQGQFAVLGFRASYRGSSFATPYVAAKIARIIGSAPGYKSKRALLRRLREFHIENQLADEICHGGSYITV
jgi:hypothetical protein